MKRIILVKGKQKQLIELAKLKFKNWEWLSHYLHCNSNYLINELRNEKRTLSEEVYNKLCKLANKEFDKYVTEKFDPNWGQIKGGKSVKNRKNLFKNKKPKILCNKSKKLAEIIGIIIGDGNIHSIPAKGIYQVRVTGNSHLKEETVYLLNYVKLLFEDVFKLSMGVRKTKSGNYLYKQSKDLVFTLNKFGLPSGNKMFNNIKIPKWIINDKKYLIPCLRGIFDTDGYVYPKNKAHTYPTISISSAIPNLRNSITGAFEILGIRLSHWREKKNSAHEAYLRTRNDNFKFYDTVSFNNPKHLAKWKMYNRAPVV